MSKSTKKTRTTRKVVGNYKLNNYVPDYRQGAKSGGSSMNDILKDESARLKAEAENIAIQSFIAQKKNEITKIQGGVGGASNVNTNDLIKSLITDSRTQQQWLAFSEDQRNTILGAVQMLNIQGNSNMQIAQYLPLLMTTMRSKPRSSMKDIFEIAKLMQGQGSSNQSMEMLKLIIPLISQRQQSGTNISEILALITPLYSSLSQKDSQLFAQEINHLRNQIVNPIQILQEIKNNAELLGYQKPQGVTPELEAQRFNNVLQIKQIDFQHEQMREQIKATAEENKNRNEMMTGLMGNLMEKGIPLITALTNQVGKNKLQQTQPVARVPMPVQTLSPQNPQPQPQPNMKYQTKDVTPKNDTRIPIQSPQQAKPPQTQGNPPKAVAFPCPDCGSAIPLNPDGSYPDKFDCDTCKKEFSKEKQPQPV